MQWWSRRELLPGENEISAAQRLLDKAPLRDKLISGDAIFAQRELSRRIVEGGATICGSCGPGKADSVAPRRRILRPEPHRYLDRASSVGKGHGRLDERELVTSFRLAGSLEFPYLEQVFRVQRKSLEIKSGKVSEQTIYGITSWSVEKAGAPELLAATRVSIRDYTGAEREAALFFVSPLQINLLIPPGLAHGFATVIVRTGGEIVASGQLTIQSTAPALFAADASGQGLSAGLALRVRADGAQVFEPVARFDPAQHKFIAVPLELSNSSEQVFLALFGTGIRGRSALSAVTAQIGGTDCEVTYAGPQGGFAGLDQVNVRLPASLAGRGEGTVSVVVDGRSANPVKVWIK